MTFDRGRVIGLGQGFAFLGGIQGDGAVHLLHDCIAVHRKCCIETTVAMPHKCGWLTLVNPQIGHGHLTGLVGICGNAPVD